MYGNCKTLNTESFNKDMESAWKTLSPMIIHIFKMFLYNLCVNIAQQRKKNSFDQNLFLLKFRESNYAQVKSKHFLQEMNRVRLVKLRQAKKFLF